MAENKKSFVLYKYWLNPISKLSKSDAGNLFKRDNYTCQHCNKKGGELNAHHIKTFAKFPELRFDVNNGLTLCKNYHINLHKNLRNER